ncbi:MAG: hypothetical protein EHM72_13585 [Calditrichaeota bacterium]|nr:MAG: hypothetical protein EHM72_13585 [Calditrichota bacterium]
MKSRLVLFLLILAAPVKQGNAQNAAVQLEILQRKFRAFDYQAVVSLTDSALVEKENFSREQLIRLHEVRAAALYSLNQLHEAFTSYMEILKLDPNYTLDPVLTSPKLVSFFKEIQAGFQKSSETSPAESSIVRIDTVREVYSTAPFYRRVLPPSLILPGAGQWLAGSKKKAVPLVVFSTLTMIWAVDASLDCREKQKVYLQSIDPAEIESHYDDYNAAYKTRNALWIAYALIWGYAQADLLFIQRPQAVLQTFVAPPLSQGQPLRFGCSLRF